MKALSTALFAVMATDATLVALLGTYKTEASIFVKRPVPVDAERPIAVAATVVSDTDADVINLLGRQVQRDIAVYGNAPTDYDKVVDAAERIRILFHRQRFPVTGWQVVTCLATGPVDAPAEPQEIGRVVTLNIRLQAA